MMASLYPAPLDVDEALELSGVSEIADQRTQKLSGGQTQRVRLAVALVSNPQLLVLDEPTVALDVEGRQAFWSDDARVRRARQDDRVRHPLPRGGRRLRRSRGADGARDDRRRRADERDQGDGRHAHDPRDASRRRCRRARSAARRQQRRAPRRGGVLRCADSDVAIRALLAAHPDARDIEIAAAGLEQAFLALTGDGDGRWRARAAAWRSAEQGERLMPLVYMRYELLRTLRNRRFFLLSLGFPLILFFVIASPNRHVRDFDGSGISFPLYYMVGAGVVRDDERDALLRRAHRRRARGRLEPPAAHHAALAPRLLPREGAHGVHDGADQPARAVRGRQHRWASASALSEWLKMTGLMLVGLVPFAALGIMLGHMLTPDSIGPAMGGGISLLALLGGVWFPLGNHGFLHDLAQYMPSYWLVQASHVGLGGHAWSTRGWIVMIAWTVVLSALAARAYRRDTGRV